MEIKNKEFFTEIKYQIEKLQIAYGNDRPKVTQLISEFMYGMIQDYEDANNDKKRLIREIDVILCGKDAAIQASLCDLVSPIKELKQKHDKLVNNEKAYLETIKVNNTMLTEIYSHFGWQFDLSAQANTEALLKANKTILE